MSFCLLVSTFATFKTEVVVLNATDSRLGVHIAGFFKILGKPLSSPKKDSMQAASPAVTVPLIFPHLFLILF